MPSKDQPTFGAYNIADLRDLARRRLPRGIFDYLDRGVEDDLGVAANRAAFAARKFLPHVGRNVSAVDQRITLFGQDMAMPLIVAPTGGAGLLWYQGDRSLAAAAASAKIPFTVSSASTMDVEDIAVPGGQLWFQLYLREDRSVSHSAVERAHNAGCRVLMMTLDIPVPPNREHNLRNGFAMPLRVGSRNIVDVLSHPRWFFQILLRHAIAGDARRLVGAPPAQPAKSKGGVRMGAGFRGDNLTWDELSRWRERWPGTFLLKGILRPDDAARAVAIGCDGIIVSNHGGRALDGSSATLDALPAVVDAVGSRTTVLLDSGVRRGSDVVRALAMGARAVMVGRAPLYGLAVGGEPGVSRALNLLREEILRTMGFLGARTLGEIGTELLVSGGRADYSAASPVRDGMANRSDLIEEG